MLEIVKALLSFVEKLALVPEAPVPVFPYSWNVTWPVRSSPVFQILQPALLMMLESAVFWKQTRAYSPHGRPRYTPPDVAVVEDAAATLDLLIT